MVVGLVILLIFAALVALIVFNWTLFVGIALWLAIVLTVVEAALALFDLVFIVYYFNLDMKLTTKLYPLFQKHYDKIKRNKQI